MKSKPIAADGKSESTHRQIADLSHLSGSIAFTLLLIVLGTISFCDDNPDPFTPDTEISLAKV